MFLFFDPSYRYIVRSANIFFNNAFTSVKETCKAFYSLLIGKKFEMSNLSFVYFTELLKKVRLSVSVG